MKFFKASHIEKYVGVRDKFWYFIYRFYAYVYIDISTVYHR